MNPHRHSIAELKRALASVRKNLKRRERDLVRDNPLWTKADLNKIISKNHAMVMDYEGAIKKLSNTK